MNHTTTAIVLPLSVDRRGAILMGLTVLKPTGETTEYIGLVVTTASVLHASSQLMRVICALAISDNRLRDNKKYTFFIIIYNGNMLQKFDASPR